MVSRTCYTDLITNFKTTFIDFDSLLQIQYSGDKFFYNCSSLSPHAFDGFQPFQTRSF